ncbi:MAG: dihydrodipicolinate synthase family protein [Bryobacteraceae bacterium]
MAESTQSLFASGVYAALATPRRPNSTEADCAALLDYLDTVARAGVDGFVLFGSTGEFVHFDIAERMRVVMLAIRRSRVPVLVNVSHSSLAGAVDLAADAIRTGAAGLMLMPPYFYRYTDDQIFAFYREFARLSGGDVPVYLYNLPFFTNPISMNLADRLFRSGAFAGIKDSSGEWETFKALRALQASCPFTLLAGHESIYVRARRAGADGIISGVAAAVPELVVAIDRAIRASDFARAQRLNLMLQEFVGWIGKFPATVGIKQAAATRGWKLNQFALPFDQKGSSDLIAFQQWFRAWLPVTLSECGETGSVRS